MQGFNPDHDPWRRGIYRAKAQRLSISLAPRAAQQSLLFRIKTDLASTGREVESYDEVDDLGESPTLYSITPSAQIKSSNTTNTGGLSPQPHHDKPPETPSSIVSLLSQTSVYSEDSWNSNSSLGPSPVDPRQHVETFSPTVQSDAFLSPALAPGHLELSSSNISDKMTERVPPSCLSTSSNAHLKMAISTSTTEVADCALIGTVNFVDEPKPVVAIRLQIENPEEAAISLVNNTDLKETKGESLSRLRLQGRSSELII